MARRKIVRDPAATRQRLLDAAVAVFAEKGYQRSSVDDVVQRSDSSKGAFYHHFANKEAIFLELLESIQMRLAEALTLAVASAHGGPTKIEAALAAVLETFAQHRELAKLLLVDSVGLEGELSERLLQVRFSFAAAIEALLCQAAEDGSIAPLDAAITATAWVGAILEVVIRWLLTAQPASLPAALPPLRDLLLRSVGLRM